jgi:hypothetical protein
VCGIHSISGAVRQSVSDLEFQIDHVACLESHGIKALRKTPVPPVYRGIYGINPHLFYVVEHLLNESLSNALPPIGWINADSVYPAHILRDKGVAEAKK